MAQDPFAKYAAPASDDPFAAYTVEPEKSRLGSIKQGAKEGASDLWEMGKEGARIAGRLFNPVGGPGGIHGVVGRLAMMQFEQGKEAKALSQEMRDPAKRSEFAKSLKPDMSDPWRGGARFTVNTILPLLTPLAPKGARFVRGGGAKFTVETAQDLAARLAKEQPFKGTPTGAATSRVPYRAPDPTAPRAAAETGGRVAGPAQTRTIMDDIAEALEETRQPEPPKAMTLPPAQAQPAVSYPKVAEPRKASTAAPAGWRQARAAAPPKETPATPLPASWQKLVDDAPAPTAAEPVAELPWWARDQEPPTLAEARRALGSRRVAAEYPQIQALAKELGISPEVMVRDLTGGPSRIPMAAREADDAASYLRRIADERGNIDLKLAAKLGLPVAGAVGGAAAADGNPAAGGLLGAILGLAAANPAKAAHVVQTLRVTGMLSGAALPKSMAGNAGAFVTAAAERGSMTPIKEAFRLPTNTRNAIKGFRGGANPSGTGGMGAINLPGRLMGAIDEASTQGLQRAGLSLDDAQRLLLTRPNPLGNGRLAEQLATPLGRAVMPFQRTPFNSGIEGMKSLNDLLPGSGASGRSRALTAGAIGGGAVAGSETDNPLLLAILAAAAGPRGVPLALGAATTAGPRVLERMGAGFPEGSWKDLLDPLRAINRPALLRLLEQLEGGGS